MKLVRQCSAVLVLLMFVMSGYLVMMLVNRQNNAHGVSQSLGNAHAVSQSLNNLEEVRGTAGKAGIKCIRGVGGECLINEDQVAGLMQVLRHEPASDVRQHVVQDVTSEKRMASHEDVIDQLHTFQMRSEAKTTTFKSGYDVGVSKECLSRDYGDLTGWPRASVIIPFCENELLADVLHTVHSIVQRSPPELLEEVILIDDNTQKGNFKEVLDNYQRAVFGGKVRVLRSNHTLGLIQGRLLGARHARGDVIITMDAHMEVQEKWLEALLYEIRLNRKTLATAMLDWMKPNGTDWTYELGTNAFMCIFSWDLGFGFGYPRPEIREQMAKDKLAAFPAPCSVGTIWAIEKKFFTEIGELDDGMELWGGENLDLPIRAWLFGGRAVQVPCSHAAHLERPHQRDYRYGWDKKIQSNYRRVVETWFDGYKEHVYRMKPELKTVPLTDISSRLEVKSRAVHDFKWFLANIFPELGLYNNNTFGYNYLRNIGMDKCLHKVGSEWIMWDCVNQPIKEGMWWTVEGHLRSDLQYWNLRSERIGNRTQHTLGPEGSTGTYMERWIAKWIHWKGGPVMVHFDKSGTDKNLCLEAYDIPEGSRVELRTCDPKTKYQRWIWRDYSEDYNQFMEQREKSRLKSNFHQKLLATQDLKQWRDLANGQKTNNVSAEVRNQGHSEDEKPISEGMRNALLLEGKRRAFKNLVARDRIDRRSSKT